MAADSPRFGAPNSDAHSARILPSLSAASCAASGGYSGDKRTLGREVSSRSRKRAASTEQMRGNGLHVGDNKEVCVVQRRPDALMSGVRRAKKTRCAELSAPCKGAVQQRRPLPPGRPLNSPSSSINYGDLVFVTEFVRTYYGLLAPGKQWEARRLSAGALMHSLKRASEGDSKAAATLAWILVVLRKTAGAHVEKHGQRTMMNDVSVRRHRGKFTRLPPKESLSLLVSVCERAIGSPAIPAYINEKTRRAEDIKKGKLGRMEHTRPVTERTAEQLAEADATLLRCTPLGFDRNGSRYWYFASAPPGVYVERGCLHAEMRESVKGCPATSATNRRTSATTGPHETPVGEEWFVYDKLEDIDALLVALNPRSRNESKLSASVRQLYPKLVLLLRATAASTATSAPSDAVPSQQVSSSPVSAVKDGRRQRWIRCRCGEEEGIVPSKRQSKQRSHQPSTVDGSCHRQEVVGES